MEKNLTEILSKIEELNTLPENDLREILIENKIFVNRAKTPYLQIRIKGALYNIPLTSGTPSENGLAKPSILNASDINTDVSEFNNNLSSADTDIQKALDTIDNLTIVDPSVIQVPLDGAGISSGKFAYVSLADTATVGSCNAKNTSVVFGCARADYAGSALGDFKISGEETNANWDFSAGSYPKKVYLNTDGYPTLTPVAYKSGKWYVFLGLAVAIHKMIIAIDYGSIRKA